MPFGMQNQTKSVFGCMVYRNGETQESRKSGVNVAWLRVSRVGSNTEAPAAAQTR